MLHKLNKIHLLLTLVITILLGACTKIQETTIGANLIPPVDNINTFDTTVDVIGSYNQFGLDSTFLGINDAQPLGIIQDPIFGRKESELFAQFKPSFYNSYPFIVPRDSIQGVDSVVLCLNLVSFFGDTGFVGQPFNIAVREIDNNFQFRDTSARRNKYPISYNGSTIPTIGSLLPGGAPSVGVSYQNMYSQKKLKFPTDSTVNQIRIKLDPAFGLRLKNIDSAGYSRDSNFQTKFNGLSLKVLNGPNGLFFVNLGSALSKIQVYFRYKNNNITDTVSINMGVTGASQTVCSIKNTFNGSYARQTAGTAQSQYLFVEGNQNAGVRLNVPALSNLNNRVVHLAELYLEEDPDPAGSNQFFTAPPNLSLTYMDVANNSDTLFPLDVQLTGSSGLFNSVSFGIGKDIFNSSAQKVKAYNFNITRHVQNIVTRKAPNHTFNLSAYYTNIAYIPRFFNPTTNLPVEYAQALIVNNVRVVPGRVRLGGNLNPNGRKCKLRIVYSKI
jgi:hypothetical protein